LPAILNTLKTAVRLKGVPQVVTHHAGHGDLSIQETVSLPTTDDVTLAPGTVTTVDAATWAANAQSPLVLNHALIQVG
jgi:hypothetical protein